MKTLRNTTSSAIFVTDAGVNIPALYTYEIDPNNYLRWAASVDVLPLLDDGSLVGNDGALDLVPALALKMLQSDVAVHVGFNNATNGFVSTNVQAAIEEARDSAEGKSRYAIGCGFDGNASTGRWLEYMTNIPSNNSPFVIPRLSTIKELSIATNGTSTVTATIYKNSTTILNTISTSGSSISYKVNLTHALVAGDKLSIKITSGSCNRPMVFIFIRNEGT